MLDQQGMGHGPRTLTLWQVRAVCIQREPTGRVTIIIVAEREEREDKRGKREERERAEKENERKREGRTTEERKKKGREKEGERGASRVLRAFCRTHGGVLNVHTETF